MYSFNPAVYHLPRKSYLFAENSFIRIMAGVIVAVVAIVLLAAVLICCYLNWHRCSLRKRNVRPTGSLDINRTYSYADSVARF